MLGSAEDIKLWEEARCPVCLEHPHNAVLLRCSSYDNGCRPFMCNTSPRHSNCLDQFHKSSGSSPSRLILPGFPCDGSLDMLTCPLCRGQVYGWFVIEPSREVMNSKTRICSNEKCEFSGNYMELREHARSDHPDAQPSVVDPEKLLEWTRLESEITLSNLISGFPTMNLADDSEIQDAGVIPPMNFGLEEGVTTLDAVTPNPDSLNSGITVETNGEMTDDDFCLDSLFFPNIGIDPPSSFELVNSFDSERVLSNPNISARSLTFDDALWNHSPGDFDFIGQNNNGTGNNLFSRQNSYGARSRRNNRNRDYFRHNNLTNSLNPRQNNSFAGNNTQRMRESRVNSVTTHNNSRNRSDRRRGNRNGSKNVSR